MAFTFVFSNRFLLKFLSGPYSILFFGFLYSTVFLTPIRAHQLCTRDADEFHVQVLQWLGYCQAPRPDKAPPFSVLQCVRTLERDPQSPVEGAANAWPGVGWPIGVWFLAAQRHLFGVCSAAAVAAERLAAVRLGLEKDHSP